METIMEHDYEWLFWLAGTMLAIGIILVAIT